MPSDDTSSIIYTAIVEEIEQGKKRIRLNIDEIGDAFITKKVWPRRQMKMGEKLEVKISHHLPTERWLVSEIVSIEGEPYTSPKTEPKKKISEGESTDETNESANVAQKKVREEFPDLDQRYVFNSAKGKSRKKIPIAYGLNLCNEDFLRSWQENSYVKLSEYSEVHDIISSHPESKFVGKIVAFNFFKGWQGFIYCKSINSLVYVRHNISRLSGSLTIGSKVEFFIGTGLDTRGELQFVARDWESNVNRGNAPEPALTLEFDEFKQSGPFVESLLSNPEQFLLITSYKGGGGQVYKADDIVKYVNKEYPKCPFQVLEWPMFKLDNRNSRATSGAGRFSHPLIANHVSAAVVLFPRDEGGEEE
jgi:hypothetical protein